MLNIIHIIKQYGIWRSTIILVSNNNCIFHSHTLPHKYKRVKKGGGHCITYICMKFHTISYFDYIKSYFHTY
jgi:hypothetical protein